MRQASKRIPDSAEKTVRDIRRNTRRHHSAEEKIRVVLEGLRGKVNIAELCRKEGINQNLYHRWSKEFLEAGKNRPEIASLLAEMLQARAAVERRSWWHPQEPTGEEWWADVLADPRARRQSRRGLRELRIKPAFYRLRDELHATILVACSKCDWKAAFDRDGLIASHGPDHLLTDLLGELASPNCGKVGHNWDRCGAYFVEPIDKGQ